MGDTGNLGNREVMDEKLYKAATFGNLVSFVEEARHNEIESGLSEEYFLSQTEDKENILHLAIRNGENEFIEKVLKGGELLPRAVTDQLIKQQDFFWETPLHDAVHMGNVEFFKLLFEYQEGQQEATVLTPVGIGLSIQNREGNTPLHLALIEGENEVASLLVKHCPDLAHGGKNNDGNTPLHVAAEVGNTEFFKSLFDYQEGQQEAKVMTQVGINAGLSMQNNEGNTPLHIALIEGKDDVASLLANHCPDLTRSRKNKYESTPLHVAAEVGNTECFKLLLGYDHKQAEVTNGDGNTPLHVAFVKSRHDIATLLFERCPDLVPNLVRVTNNMKETPLHLAIEQYRQIINLPIKKREDLSSTYLGMIKLMIEKESCVACMQDATGATPLHRAASITSTYTLQIIGLMLDHCPQSVEVRDNSGKTILHLLKTIPSYEEAKALLGVKGLLGLINHQDKQGNTPLHWAAMNLNYNMVRALLNSFAKRSIINNDGIAAEDFIQEQFEVIMEKKQMTMEVCEATERADVTFLKERLLKFGMIFLFPRDSNRRNILHKLMQLNSGMTMLHADFVDFVKQVLESFPELICQVDLNGDTPLHILLQNSPNTMIPLAFAPCNYKVLPLSESPLVEELFELFCSYFNKAQEEATVKGGRYDPPWLVQNAAGNTPLHEALRVNHGNKVVKKLLELDIAVTAKLTNNLKETPLHLVGGRPEAAEPLDEDDMKTLKDANKDAAFTFDKNGLTPLLRAAQIYNLFIISTFLKQSPEATFLADEKYGKTLLHLLINHPSYSTKNLLKVHSELKKLLVYDDYEGNTPLHLAIQGGRFDHAFNFLKDMEPTKMNELLEKKNDAGTTPCDLIRSAQEIPIALDKILNRHRELLGYRSVHGIAASNVDVYVNTIGVIAALLMTITFTAAFTVPGGAVQDSANEKSKGTPILVNDVAFQVFMFFDILTMCLSAMVLFCLLWILAADNKRKSVMLMDSSILLLLISFYTTLLTFMAGVYATTIYVKPWIAIYTLVICALLMIFMRKDIIVNCVGRAGPMLSFYWKKLSSCWLGLIKCTSTKTLEEEEE